LLVVGVVVEAAAVEAEGIRRRKNVALRRDLSVPESASV
jgi:hypothetical protein